MLLRFLAILILISANANALEMSSAKTVGKGEYYWGFWTVYDAELVTHTGIYEPEKPFALKLTYQMKFDGSDIADRSVTEMRAQKAANEVQLAKWHVQMQEIFPNVKEGDSITGINDANGKTIFLFNGEQVGTINDAEFAKAFFDIWLSKKTSEPKLREKLLAGQ